jgi:hypothetical protein
MRHFNGNGASRHAKPKLTGSSSRCLISSAILDFSSSNAVISLSIFRVSTLGCEDTPIVSILNRLGYRTGNGNAWTEKRVQHLRHTNGFPACPPSEQRL